MTAAPSSPRPKSAHALPRSPLSSLEFMRIKDPNMKPSQFAKGFQARPDSTSSEKRTALDRLNAIDNLVKNEPSVSEKPAPSRHEIPATVPVDGKETSNDSADYHAWPQTHGYT